MRMMAMGGIRGAAFVIPVCRQECELCIFRVTPCTAEPSWINPATCMLKTIE